jgi:hypothetical protein
VRQLRTATFEAQRQAYVLRFCCEHCVHFDAERAACTHRYPNAEHRLAHQQSAPPALVFCKEFDLV